MPDPLERGVYVLDFVSPEGFPIIVSVGDDGRQVGEMRVIWPFETEEDVVEAMWEDLDRLDPQEAWKGDANG